MAKYYYNGVILPEIPADVLASYQMCLIYLKSDGTNYRLLAGTKTWYVRSSSIYLESSTYVVYGATAESDSWVYETQYTDTGNFGIGNGIKWSNHDIPNGSATATEIYLNGSNPAPIIETPQEYIVNNEDWYVSDGKVSYTSNQPDILIKYLFPIKNGVVYRFKSLEAHNRLRAMVTTADMSVVTGAVTGTAVGTDMNDPAVGTILTHQATFNGWMCIYVSNADEHPAVEIIAYEPVGLKVHQHIEAEDGVLSGGATVADRMSTSGNIVVDLITSSSGSLTLDFVAPASDFYVIRMYATFSGTRDFKYTVNGKTYTRTVTGTTYYGIEHFDFQLYLNEGVNTIIFKGYSTTYAPMFDSFDVCSYKVGFEEGEVADCFNIREPITIQINQSVDMESEWLNGFDSNTLRRAYITYPMDDVIEYLGCADISHNETDKSYQLTFFGYQNTLGSVKLVATLSTTFITVNSIEATNHSGSWADVSAQLGELTLQLLEPCGASHTNCFTPASGINVVVGSEATVAEKLLKGVSTDSLLRSFVTFQKNSAEYSMGCINAVDAGFHGYELTFITNYASLGALRIRFYVDEIGTAVRFIEADSNTGIFADVMSQFNGTEFVLNLLEATNKDDSTIPNQFTFDFSNTNWRTAYPNYYSVTDSNGFYTASTFQYNGKDTLRSYGIGHSGTSKTEITFKLVTAGSIAFNYCVTSENKYDWLTINIDGTQVVRKSGSVAWTDYTQNLSVGTHTITLMYTKDGSTSVSPDAGAIGYLSITGMYIDIRYLVRSEDNIYTTDGGTLHKVTEGVVKSLLFRLYGGVDVPDSDLIKALPNPTILIWSDSDFESNAKVNMYAEPYPQTFESTDYFMTDETILGIEKAVAVATESVQFAVSFDSGATWKTFIDGTWAELSESSSGMSATTLNAITTESWNAMATNGKFRFRISLMDRTSEFTSLIVDYLNKAETPAEINEGDE